MQRAPGDEGFRHCRTTDRTPQIHTEFLRFPVKNSSCGLAPRLGIMQRMNQLIELDIIVRTLIGRLVELHGAANLADYLEHLAHCLRRRN